MLLLCIDITVNYTINCQLITTIYKLVEVCDIIVLFVNRLCVYGMAVLSLNYLFIS
jgi:hypothetical protein